MHKLASLNHDIKSVSEIYLKGISPALLYGRSVFTTIAGYNSEIFQWRKHWRRLIESAARLDIDLSDFSESKVFESINDLISANNFQNGRLRVTFFDQKARGLWSFGTETKTSLLIISADFKSVTEDFKLTVSPFPVNSKSPLNNLKSGNYLENALALEKSRRHGCDEAVRLNERDEIVSAVMANLFWVIDKTIYTPPLETGALSGTTRAFVKENFQITEKIITLPELKFADEIFLTSAGIGIAKVKIFEEKELGEPVITNDIRHRFCDAAGK